MMKEISILICFTGMAFYSVAQNVGIGTLTPQAKLHIYDGASGITPFFSARLVVETNNHTYINLLSPDPFESGILFGSGTNAASGLISYNSSNTPKGFQFGDNGNQTRMVINNTGNVGIGTTAPNARLSISANGTELAGTAMSGLLKTNAGTLGNNTADELSLASIGFIAGGNNTSLGIRAYRNSAGPGWSNTSFLLGYDVDNTVRAGGGFLAINSNGNIGIGVTNPSEKLEVTGNAKANNFVYTSSKTFYYSLSGSDFRAERSSDTIIADPGGNVYMQSYAGLALILAPVHLPHGATLVKMTAYINDFDANNLLVVLNRRTITSNIFPDNLGSVSSSGASGGIVPYPVSLNSIVDNNTYTYFIWAESTGNWYNGPILVAVVIEYTLSSAQ